MPLALRNRGVRPPGAHPLESDEQQEAAFDVCRVASRTAAPLQRLEHGLLPLTTFVVLP